MKFSLIIILCALSVTFCEAQLLKNLSKKVDNAVERTIENKAEQKATDATNDAIDKSIEKEKKNKSKSQNNPDTSRNETMETGGLDFSKMMDALGEEAQYEEVYTFDHRVRIKNTLYKNGKTKDEDFFTYLIGPNTLGMDHEENEAELIVVDSKNESMLTLDRAEKKGQALSMKFAQAMMDIATTENSEEETTQKSTLKKTGNKKTINGYSCEEYHMTWEGHLVEGWVTQEAAISYKDFMETFTGFVGSFAKGGSSNSLPFFDIDGFVIYAKTYEKEELINEMEVIEIDSKAQILELNSYNIEQTTTGY